MNCSIGHAARVLAVAGLAGGLLVGLPGSPAGAQPAAFPNLDDFTAVSVDDYLTTGPKGPGRWVNFSTPYNISCQFVAAGEPGTLQAISCDGDMPGMDNAPYAQGSPEQGWCLTGTVRTENSGSVRLNRQSVMCPAGPFDSGKPLNVGQKVSYQNVTCAVGADRLVACLDTSAGQHGFVLKPSGSSAF
ncbi:MAG: hypothetical protein ABI253_08880 [Mycobacterium sp.]